MKRGWAIVGGSLLVLAFCSPVRAATPALAVRSTCPGLNAALVKKLLRIELSTVMNSKPHDLRVHVACKGHRATVRIVDSLTRKTVVRSFGVRHDRPDLERVVALAAAQLFVVSWLELLTTASPHRPRSRAVVRAARKVARRAVRKGRSWRPTLGVETAVAVRDLTRPLAAYGAALRLGLELGRHWQFSLALTFAGGRAAREPGDVELLMPGVRIGALWRWFRFKHVELASELQLALLYVRLRGLADPPVGSVADGVAGEAVLGSGPRFVLGRFRLSVQLQVGVTFPALTGRVAGDRDVRPGLAWVGGALVFEGVLW